MSQIVGTFNACFVGIFGAGQHQDLGQRLGRAKAVTPCQTLIVEHNGDPRRTKHGQHLH
ncbi:hypothetical protein [Sphaerimonospora mesophila]|uniref:hypothetical protein n=1 Tax=Sphaerimonospora mesophila TaxID=37483 RepID=UPI00136549B7